MLLKFFNNKQPIMLLLLPLIVFVLWSKSIFGYNDFISQENSVLIKEIYSLLGNNSMIISIVASLLVLLLSYLLIKLNEAYVLTDKSSFLPAFFYIIIVSGIRFVQFQSHVIFAAIFLFLAFMQMFSAYKHDEALSSLFKATFFIAIGSFFYIKILFFFPVILGGVIITKSFNWREWMSMLIGFIVPFIIYFSILFILNNLEIVLSGFRNDLFSAHTHVVLKLNDIIFLGFLLIIGLFSIISVLFDYNTKKIDSRKFLSTLIFLIIGVIVIYFIFETNAIELIYFLGIPLSIFLTDYFSNNRRKWIKEVLFSVLVGIVIYSQIVG